MVAGGVMRPLAVKASNGSVRKMAGYVLLLSAGKVGGKLW